MTAIDILPILFAAVVGLSLLCTLIFGNRTPVTTPRPTRRITHLTADDFDAMEAGMIEAIKAKHREGQRLVEAGHR